MFKKFFIFYSAAVLWILPVSGALSETDQHSKKEFIKNFLTALINGDTGTFWNMLSDRAKKEIMKEMFYQEDIEFFKEAVTNDEILNNLAQGDNIEIVKINGKWFFQPLADDVDIKETDISKNAAGQNDNTQIRHAASVETFEDSAEENFNVDRSSRDIVTTQMLNAVLDRDEDLFWALLSPAEKAAGIIKFGSIDRTKQEIKQRLSALPRYIVPVNLKEFPDFIQKLTEGSDPDNPVDLNGKWYFAGIINELIPEAVKLPVNQKSQRSVVMAVFLSAITRDAEMLWSVVTDEDKKSIASSMQDEINAKQNFAETFFNHGEAEDHNKVIEALSKSSSKMDLFIKSLPKKAFISIDGRWYIDPDIWLSE